MDDTNIRRYVTTEWGDCTIESVTLAKTFSDMGISVRVWNIELKDEDPLWVVEGDSIPMNVYPQKGIDFGDDEVYSFHMGLICRLFGIQLEEVELSGHDEPDTPSKDNKEQD